MVRLDEFLLRVIFIFDVMEQGIKLLSEFVRPARLARMKQVLQQRTFNRVHLVFERPHNEFNILACIRYVSSSQPKPEPIG
jgi:hypothetical protein